MIRRYDDIRSSTATAVCMIHIMIKRCICWGWRALYTAVYIYAFYDYTAVCVHGGGYIYTCVVATCIICECLCLLHAITVLRYHIYACTSLWCSLYHVRSTGYLVFGTE